MYNFSKITNRKNSNSLKWDIEPHELPMWVADMDFETAPEIIEDLHQRVSHGIFGYNIVPDEYFESIKNWWQERHNYKIKKEWMMFCIGVVPAISSIIRKVTTVGENILIQAPVYNIFYNSILNNGRHVLSSDLIYDGVEYHIDFEDLEQKLALPQTTLMILCNPHNPIGKIWDHDTLRRIGDLCAKYHVIVLSDEIHCDITASQKEYIPFASVSTTNLMNSITCISPSKAFNLAGLQSACIIAANPLLHHKVNRGINTDEIAEPNSFAIQASISAYTKGGYWLDELREYLETNKKRAISFINENLPMLHVINSEATYLLWIDCSKVSYDSVDLVKVIRVSTGLYISAGYEYGENSKSFIRMNIACPQALLDDGLQRFKEGILVYLRRKIKMEQKLLERMHRFEDVINIEMSYHKTTEEIMKQYLYQKGDGHDNQEFNLADEELNILDVLIQI